jgi:chromosome segregation ATPase
MVIDQANAKLERMLQKQIKSDGVEDNIHDEKECGILLDNIATILTTFMGQEPKPSELSNINPDMKLRRLEDIMQAQKLENDFLRMEVNDLKSERDMELILLNSEKARLEEKFTSNARLLADKDRQMANQEKELEILRESLKATTAGYISGDDSFSETDSYVCDSYVSGANKRDDTNGGRKVYSPPRDKYTSLVEAKEKAEIDAKTNSDNLETAKKIISSLEESHKKTTQDLKTRLHSSNETIASLLDISNKFEKETADLKAEIKMLREAEGKRQEETSRLSNLIPKNDDSLPGLT